MGGCGLAKQDIIHRALDLIDVTDQQVARHSDALGLATTADDIERLHREGKIAILMGVEGATRLKAICTCLTSTFAWASVI